MHIFMNESECSISPVLYFLTENKCKNWGGKKEEEEGKEGVKKER